MCRKLEKPTHQVQQPDSFLLKIVISIGQTRLVAITIPVERRLFHSSQGCTFPAWTGHPSPTADSPHLSYAPIMS